MPATSTKILNQKAIEGKIKRIAFQILEDNYKETTIYFAGINGGGVILAERIRKELHQIGNIEVKLIEIKIDKADPHALPVSLDVPMDSLVNSVVILIDDVLNSGKTMAYALKPFLSIAVKKIETAFLVNRSHKLFPISAKYTGIELSTTLQEHINVSWVEGDVAVYLD